MSSLSTNPFDLAARRAQLVADAVVSQYLTEISPPQRPSRPAPPPASVTSTARLSRHATRSRRHGLRRSIASPGRLATRAAAR